MKVVIDLSEKELDRLIALTGYDIDNPIDAEEAIHILIKYA